MSVEAYLHKICTVFQNRLGSNLVGIYLHGSLAMECFHPENSDVDILVIIKDKIPKELKKKIIQDLLALNEYPLEMSILLEHEVIELHHPTPFELHYSKVHRDRYLNDPHYICGDSVDPDLAAHLVVTYERGKCLFGKSIKEVFKPVPPTHYLQSIMYDIENAEQEIVKNPVYYTLNLCRVLYYIKEGVVASKKEGGEWGMNAVDERYKEIVKNSLAIYLGSKEEIRWDNSLLIRFAKNMLSEIRSNQTYR
ncbi:streptomycin 3''-adenylyltransferase [Heyndrickxia sporothermodurans]|nr:streptomycin 3''-adenylyltransferase [Heyndrickxia sporothermodurans]